MRACASQCSFVVAWQRTSNPVSGHCRRRGGSGRRQQGMSPPRSLLLLPALFLAISELTQTICSPPRAAPTPVGEDTTWQSEGVQRLPFWGGPSCRATCDRT